VKLRIHYLDGEHLEIEFGEHPRARTWYWGQRTLIVRGHDRDRAEYPIANIRFLDVCVEDGES
jgi:hypothetical protein